MEASLSAIKKLKVAELRSELEVRGLDSTGVKSDLLQRLINDELGTTTTTTSSTTRNAGFLDDAGEFLQSTEDSMLDDRLLDDEGDIDESVERTLNGSSSQIECVGDVDPLADDSLGDLNTTTPLSEGTGSVVVTPNSAESNTNPSQQSDLNTETKTTESHSDDNNSSKLVDTTHKVPNPASNVDQVLKRAKRFGVPVTDPSVKKETRLHRFSGKSAVPSTTTPPTEAGSVVEGSVDKKRVRADRFNDTVTIDETTEKEKPSLKENTTITNNEPPLSIEKPSLKENTTITNNEPPLSIEKLKQRSERFGGVILSSTLTKTNLNEKILKRKERFDVKDVSSTEPAVKKSNIPETGLFCSSTVLSKTEEKRKQRLARFAGN